jgi:hypothetical protein
MTTPQWGAISISRMGKWTVGVKEQPQAMHGEESPIVISYY